VAALSRANPSVSSAVLFLYAPVIVCVHCARCSYMHDVHSTAAAAAAATIFGFSKVNPY